MAQQSSPQQPTPTTTNSHINHDDDDVDESTHNTSTVETTSSCIIVVLLVCGLPGSGKSTFVNDLVQKYSNNSDTTGSIDDTIPTTTIHTIVYDDLQKEILLRPQLQQQQQKEDASNTFVVEVPSDIEPTSYSNDPILLQSWRQSRLIALQRLQRLLTAVSTDSNDTQPRHRHHCHMIVMDDNFYLRSMRKQIYRLCVNQYHHSTTTTNNNNNTNNNAQLYFGTIYMDTPLDTCLQRNRQRPEQYTVNHDTACDGIQLHVTDETIQRMHSRFEVPSGCHPVHQPIHWDNAVWTISHTTSTPLLHDPVRDVQQWILHCIVPTVSTSYPRSNYSNSNNIDVNNRQLLYRILPNTPTNINDHVPKDPSIPNDRHLADVFWRTCVAAVAQQLSSASSSKIPMANQVRKYCIQQLQLQPQQHVTDCSMETKKRLWWNMFVQGSCTPSVTLSITTSAASTWLTTEEQQILYFYIFPK